MEEIRSPVCCVLGHVDVGKTKLLDALRKSNVQAGESGGITQQIGATYFPREYINKLISSMNKTIDVPGVLLIDTPGHDCFTNLRLRSIEIADIAIVVVNIIKGLQKQTIECINLLKKNRTPFVIALNKLDMVDGWVKDKKASQIPINLKKCFVNQKKNTKLHIDTYIKNMIVQLAENEINAAACFNNPNDREFVSMVPVSATTNEGIPDLLMVVSKLSAKYLKKKLILSEQTCEGHVLDIFKDPHHGTVVNVILTNGILKHGDTAVFCSEHGPHEDKIGDIFKPLDSKEMKGKTAYETVSEVKAAKGIMIKINSPNNVLSGSKFYVYTSPEQLKGCKEKVEVQLERYKELIINKVYKKNGVIIVSPNYGPLEALWNMTSNDIDISNMVVGQINKKTIMIAANNLDKTSEDALSYSKQWTVVLNYQDKASKEMHEFAKANGVVIFEHDIIYHLVDDYNKYRNGLYDEIRERHPKIVPEVRLEVIPQYIFRKSNPVIVGVSVKKGTLKTGTELVGNSGTVIGTVVSIESNNSAVNEGKVNEDVCIKIENASKQEYFDEKILTNYLNEADKITYNRYPKVFKF